MQNLYPLFEQNRILKKELLWSLRDYSFAHIQLEYQEYGQGIIQGCDITVRGDELIVGPGIFKYDQFVCLLKEESNIPYTPAEQMQYLRLRVEVDQTSPDYIAYRMEFFLTTDEDKSKNEFELCRFHLRCGAKLRGWYRDFTDMETEYDTVSLIHADWSGMGGKTLAPVITKYFAETVLLSGNSQPEDRSFAYLCLNQTTAVSSKVLAIYASFREGKELDSIVGNLDIYKYLDSIIRNIQSGKEKREGIKKERHRILVD